MKLLPREEELKKIFRYKGAPCDPMFYRPNLLIHSRRVEWLAIEIVKFLNIKTNKNIDVDLVKEMARFHDDVEIITGDYLSMDKETLSSDIKKYYDSQSISAIDILYENYPNISEKYNYKDLVNRVEKKLGLEFQIVDFADKLDAHLEVSHELFSGNTNFLVKLEKWGIDLTPFHYTKNKLSHISKNIFTYFKENIDIKESFFDLDKLYDEKKCLDNKRKHKLGTLNIKTGYNIYDLWIQLHFKYGIKEDINYLINQIEFNK